VSTGLKMMHLYECIYKDGQEASSHLVRPLHINNQHPYKRELQAYVHMFNNGFYKHNGHTGLFSPKFELKTKVSFTQFIEFCESNQDSDVILINPFPQIKYWASNAWMQGEFMHPGLVKIAQDLLCAAEIDLEVNTQDRHSDDYLCFCNFWVAHGWVWESFVGHVLVKLNDFVDDHPQHPAVRAANAGTQHTSEACFLPFITERLLSSWLFANRSKLKIARFKPTLAQVKSLYCFNDFERDLVEKTHLWVDALDASDRPLTPDEYQKLHQACHEYAVFTHTYYSKLPHPHV
jgi:hypothetical protein